jgi:hypothetical protein
VEGFYHCFFRYRGTYPALLTEQAWKVKPVTGRIIELREDGVLFEEEQTALVQKTVQKFYTKKQIVALVDSAGRVILGELPEEYSTAMKLIFQFKRADSLAGPPARPAVKSTPRSPSPKPPSFAAELLPNKKFGFCLPPGTYEVSRILLVDSELGTSEAVDPPQFSFVVEENHATYIGDIYANFEGLNLGRCYSVEFSREGHYADPARDMAYSGLLGALVRGGTEAPESGEHNLEIVDDSTFVAASKLEVNRSLLSVHE